MVELGSTKLKVRNTKYEVENHLEPKRNAKTPAKKPGLLYYNELEGIVTLLSVMAQST
jgi:hypothetical protein